MTSRKTAFALVVALGAAGLLVTVVLAFVSTTGRPLAPAVGYATNTTTHLVVWAEDRGTGTGLDLYAVRATSSGIVVGSEIPLVVAPGDQSDPALAYDERDGEFLVVFTQTGGPNVTPSPAVPIPGTPPGGTPGPFPSPPGPPVSPNNGPAFVAQPGPGVRVGAATAYGSGGPSQPNTPPPLPTIATSTPTGPNTPAPGPTLPTPGGPTAPATSLPPPAGTPPIPPPSTAPGSRDIYGLWVADGGFPLTNTFPIIASPADETYPTLAYRAASGQDQWVLVWREVTGLDVALRTVELVGFGRTMIFGSGVNTILGGADIGRPSVAGLPSGDFLVAWSQTQTGNVDRDILARRLNSNGFPVASILKLVDSREDQVYPSLGALSDQGEYLLAWEEHPVGAPPDIRVRRINRNGIPVRAAYDLSAGPPFSFAPSLPNTNQSTLLLVWLDRNPASDHSILGAEVTREGRRIGVVRTIVAGGTGPGAVTPVGPPPGPGLPTLPPVPPGPPTP